MSLSKQLDIITDGLKECGSDGHLAVVIKGNGAALTCHEMGSDDLLAGLTVIMEFYKSRHRRIYDMYQKMHSENPEAMTKAFSEQLEEPEGDGKELAEAKEAMAKAIKMMEKATSK